MKMKNRLKYTIGFFLLAGIIWGLLYFHFLLPITTGYTAKYLCSAVFISHREVADVENTDLNFSFLKFVRNEVNDKEKSVISRFLWGKSKAIFRDGFGSTLLRETDEATLRKEKFPFNHGIQKDQDTLLWPLGNKLPNTVNGIDKKELDRIARKLVFANGYDGNAFAFLVLHKGIPVAEKYRSGFNEKTRFPGWSIAKSFTNALAGIMVMAGMWDIHRQAAIAEWQKDERKLITINDLMQMQSGLHWDEDYGTRSDVTLMLYGNDDFAKYAINKPIEYPAGSKWYYSSGSTNILCYLMRKQFRNDEEYHLFAPTRLFHKTGMDDAVFEVDPKGTLVGSSYIYATARDYARFGLLYLQDGVFNGERILPEGWVRYTVTPADHSNGNYGASFWLNRGKMYPSAPEDMYFCNGHDGQRIFILPTQELIVVVLGYSPKPDGVMNFDALLGDILGALKK
jgi:CubicO group peptidase (beta-lactamase class C family)